MTQGQGGPRASARADARHTVFVVGTRAQLIKIAPVAAACERLGRPGTLLMTGQHKETMQDLVEEFGLASPQVHALESRERATVGSLLGWLPRAYFGIVRELRALAACRGPLDVVVHGDTASTVLGALAGRRVGARVVHVESGLTSGRLWDPFPEEISRRIVFRLADVALCPGPEQTAFMHRYRLLALDTGGNTILDAVRLAAPPPAPPGSPRYVVASLHRFQNLYSAPRLRALVAMLEQVAAHLPVYFVLHPATRRKLAGSGELARLESVPGIRLLPRLGYREFLTLAANAACVLTDGGSNQEELSALGVPTLVMRERTERQDGLGANAMMEADVPGGVAAFLAGGGYETLRRPSTLGDALGPSMFIARFFAGPAVAPAP
jgi:UDP-N-acetylglucosamine 2-epimerase (non-hydrolysing)